MEMAAFAAAKVLTESLKHVGREFETGVMPPITFGPNRRLGIRGALLVSMDEAGHVTASDWVEVSD
jgi:hypothetical protein